MSQPAFHPLALTGLAILSLVAAFMLGNTFSKNPNLPISPSKVDSSSPNTPAYLRTSESSSLSNRTIADRVLATIDLLEGLQTPSEFRETMADIISHADKTEKERLLALLFAAWLERDPQSAFAEVRQVEFLRYYAERVARAFSHWAESNPQAAADLLAQTLDGRQLEPEPRPPYLDGVDPPEFLLSLVSGMAQSEPQLAADTLTASQASPARVHALEVLMQDWFPTAPEEVFAWASSLSDGLARAESIAIVATKAGQLDDPAAGLAWANNQPNPDDQLLALQNLTSQWSQRHSRDAFTWITSLPDDELKFQLMPATLRQFALIDPGAAADWLNQYDPSPRMDASIAAYVRTIQTANPEAARGSAEAISDPALREQVLEAIARTGH